jgi:hypothetical protein
METRVPIRGVALDEHVHQLTTQQSMETDNIETSRMETLRRFAEGTERRLAYALHGRRIAVV